MGSKLEIVQTLALEFGKSSPEVLAQIESKVGEITVDILSQNDCRFAGLRKWQRITVGAGTKAYKVNADLASVGRHAKIVNVNGDFLYKFTIVDEGEFIEREDKAGYATTRYGWIEARDQGDQGPGFYLVLATDWQATGYIKMPYFRSPTENDTALIRNTSAVKDGVRQYFPQYVGEEKAALFGRVYSGKRKSIKESPDRVATGLHVKPPRRVQAGNRLMHKIGRYE